MIPRLPKGFSHPMRIGEGAFSSVYRVRQKALDRWVAIKIYKEKNAEARRELLKEARLQAQLRIQCIPAVFDAFEWRGQVCIVMQWIKGVPLSQLMERRLTDDQRRIIAGAFLSALANLHHAGYVHGDIKPANVLISPDEGLLLVDFGFTRNARQGVLESLASQAKGTPAYMAPEIWQGRSDIDWTRTDVFSAGRILTQLLPANDSGLVSAMLEENAAGRPADGSEALKKWRAAGGMTRNPQGTGDWRELAGGLSSSLLAKNLFAAARRLVFADRTEEAYWLLAECIEENPDFPEAVEIMGSIPDLHERSQRRRLTASATAAALLLSAVIGAFVYARFMRVEPDTGPTLPAGRRSVLLTPDQGPDPSDAGLPLLEVGARSEKLDGFVYVHDLPETVSLVVDGNILPPPGREPLLLAFGAHVFETQTPDGRVGWRERLDLLPFQTVVLRVPPLNPRGPLP